VFSLFLILWLHYVLFGCHIRDRLVRSLLLAFFFLASHVYRDGDNLIIHRSVPLANALTGFSFELTHLDGKKINIATPQGMVIQPDMVLEVTLQ
jgi:hypothetical protein